MCIGAYTLACLLFLLHPATTQPSQLQPQHHQQQRAKHFILSHRIVHFTLQASRQRAKAEKFRDHNRLPRDVKIYEGYNALLEDPEIDAVYIPLPTTMHLEWVVKAANAHKHVLIEKPVAIDADQFYIMIMTCKNNNVLLMDGVMFMHHERLRTLNMFLKDPRCGQVTPTTSTIYKIYIANELVTFI